METFARAKEFVEDSGYARARQRSVAALDLTSIDDPITDIVDGFASLPHCFTLQCCYGHFLCAPEQDPHNFEPFPLDFTGTAKYKVAYIAFCLENSVRGRELRRSLARLTAVDPDYVQFGSADWFWERWANSYALQVEPQAHMLKDEAILEPAEARHTQKIRDLLFAELRALLAAELVDPEES